jgi:hypothetical protein
MLDSTLSPKDDLTKLPLTKSALLLTRYMAL